MDVATSSLQTTLLVERLYKLESRIGDLLKQPKPSGDVERLREIRSNLSGGRKLLDSLSRSDVEQNGAVQALLVKLWKSVEEITDALETDEKLLETKSPVKKLLETKRNEDSLRRAFEDLCNTFTELENAITSAELQILSSGNSESLKETFPPSLSQASEELRRQLKTSPLYDTFRDALGAIPTEQHIPRRSTVLQVLWQKFPQWHDLQGKVGNVEDPGDGLIYDIERVTTASQLLRDFYNAWLKSENLIGSPPPVALPHVGKICLILTGMGKQALLEDFLDSKIADNHLPLQRSDLEKIFKPQDKNHARTFAAEQYRAVARKWEDGDHVVLGDGEALPLELERWYYLGKFSELSRVRDSFSGAYYATQRDSEQTTPGSREQLQRNAERLRSLSHRHIIRFIKSYERGNTYGILLKPAVTTDLQDLMQRYRRNRFQPEMDCKDSVWLRPLLLTAFGCLGVGLAYSHGCKIRHGDIKPSNILYEEASAANGHTPQFLLANFGLAQDLSKTNKRYERGPRVYSVRYAAPEMVSANMVNVIWQSLGKLTMGYREMSDDRDAIISDKGFVTKCSSDIFSLGCVFSELLACLVEQNLEENRSTILSGGNQAFCKRISQLTAWMQRCRDSNRYPELNLLFSLTAQMISKHPEQRPTADEIVQRLARKGSYYFCASCSQEMMSQEEIVPQASRVLGMSASRPASPERVARNKAQGDSRIGLDEVQHPRPILKRKSKARLDLGNTSNASEKPNMESSMQLPHVAGLVAEKEPEQRPWQQVHYSLEHGHFDDSRSNHDLASVCSRDFAGHATLFLRGIKELLTNSFDSSSNPCTATLSVDWPIQAYVARELQYDPSLKHQNNLLDKVLTITGNASKAYADTAKAYVQWKWPEARVSVLELVSALLSARHNGDSSPRIERDDCSVTFASENPETILNLGTINVTVTGAVEGLVQVAEQFAWLSASFREHKEGQISYSDISFTKIGTTSFELRRMKLEMARPSETSCWLPIFTNSIIARGFPVPPRPNAEEGIELPFQVMVNLAKVMYPVSHMGGFYLKGFSNIIFPAAISPDGTSVQWHMFMPSALREYLSPGTLPHNNDSWVKADNIEVLTSANRIFLGYVHSIEGHLGTNTEIALKSIRTTLASGAYDEDPAIAVEINKIETGTSGFGIWGFQATADILYPKGLYHTAETGWYIDMLDIAKARPMIVYDHAEESRRAWLVPTLSVVLHMAHIWGRDKTDIGPLPVAKLQWDAGEAAYIAIKEHSKDNLRDPLEADKQYLVRDLIGRLLICLEKLMGEEAKARSEPRRSVSLEKSTKLYGWDLLGIARGDGNVWRQQLNVDQDWRVLGKDLAVLFCQNIGELVRPAPNVKLCATADAARLRQDRLIAPIKSLRWLSNKRGKSADSVCLRLGNKVFWQSPGNALFSNCVDCLPASHHGLFAVRRAHGCAKQAQQFLKEDCPAQKATPPPLEGAVGFGIRKLHKPRLLTPDSASLSQSQSSDTQATSVSASEISTPPSAVDSKEEQKTRRKLKKRRAFGVLVDRLR